MGIATSSSAPWLYKGCKVFPESPVLLVSEELSEVVGGIILRRPKDFFGGETALSLLVKGLLS